MGAWITLVAWAGTLAIPLSLLPRWLAGKSDNCASLAAAVKGDDWRRRAPQRKTIEDMAYWSRLPYWGDYSKYTLSDIQRFANMKAAPDELEVSAETMCCGIGALAKRINDFQHRDEVHHTLQRILVGLDVGAAHVTWLTNVHGGVVVDPGNARIMLFYRGTVDNDDMVADVGLWPHTRSNPSEGRVHTGFHEHANAGGDLQAGIRAVVQACETYPRVDFEVLITGHSLGA